MREMLGVLLVIVALTAPLGARTVLVEKKCDPAVLLEDLKRAGIDRASLECPTGRVGCRLHIADDIRADPMPVIRQYRFRDAALERERESREMKGLLAKWKEKRLSADEKDRLLAWTVERVLARE